MKNLPLLIGPVLIVWLLFGGQTPDTTPDTDPVTPASTLIADADDAYWQQFAALCEQMADEYPDGWTPTAVKEWNAALMIIRGDTHNEINRLKSEAAANGTLKEFATRVKGGTL